MSQNYKYCKPETSASVEYTPSADDLKNLWRMTDPAELKRRGVPSVAEYLQAAIQDDTDASKKATHRSA